MCLRQSQGAFCATEICHLTLIGPVVVSSIIVLQQYNFALPCVALRFAVAMWLGINTLDEESSATMGFRAS